MWHWVTPIITQCLENLTESGELSVSMLGSLCSPCNMQDKCHHVSCFMFTQYHRLRYFKGQLRTRFLDDWRWLKQYPNTIFSLPYMAKIIKTKIILKNLCLSVVMSWTIFLTILGNYYLFLIYVTLINFEPVVALRHNFRQWF